MKITVMPLLLIILSTGCDDTEDKSGIYIDKKTNLTWMRCTVDQKWNGNSCEGNDLGNYTKHTLNDALKKAADYAGYSDWRIPNIDELNSLVVCHGTRDFTNSRFIGICSNNNNKNFFAIDKMEFPNSYARYVLSSTTSNKDINRVCGVYFRAGAISCDGAQYSGAVRLVRNTQPDMGVNISKLSDKVHDLKRTKEDIQLNEKPKAESRNVKIVSPNSDGSYMVMCKDRSYGTVTMPTSSICVVGNGKNKCKTSSSWSIEQAAVFICN